jgi:hypothetical protein
MTRTLKLAALAAVAALAIGACSEGDPPAATPLDDADAAATEAPVATEAVVDAGTGDATAAPEDAAPAS